MKISLIILFLFGFLFTTSCTKSTTQVVLQKISFTPETLTVKSGTTVQLAPVFTPAVFSNIDVVWTSTNANTAYVSSTGDVSTFAPGTAWVSVKDKNSATAGKCLIIVQ